MADGAGKVSESQHRDDPSNTFTTHPKEGQVRYIKKEDSGSEEEESGDQQIA